jgi:hypothetical protein
VQGVVVHAPHGTLANEEPRRVYFCNTQRRGCGKITAMVSYVDERLEEFVVERLSDPKHAAGCPRSAPAATSD